MTSLLTLLSSLASGEAADAARRAKRAAAMLALVGLFGLCALIFFLGAGFFATAQRVGLVEASLIFGGGFFAVALLIFVFHKITSAAQARKARQRRQSEFMTLGATALVAIVPSLLAGRGRMMTLAMPALVGLAYFVYRENTREPRGGRPPRDPMR